MPDVRLPLAGDVSQVINPLSWIARWAGNQFGLVNISVGKSSDPDAEHRILNEVGSYGKQLGRLGDAVGVLMKHLNQETLSDDEKIAILLLKEQLREIESIKRSTLSRTMPGESL